MNYEKFLNFLSQQKKIFSLADLEKHQEEFLQYFAAEEETDSQFSESSFTEETLDSLEKTAISLTEKVEKLSFANKSLHASPSENQQQLINDLEQFSSQIKSQFELLRNELEKTDRVDSPYQKKTFFESEEEHLESLAGNQKKLGKTKERYTLLETLGEGGMGLVQRVHDNFLGRDVALKRIKLPLQKNKTRSTKQKKLLWRLEREASITAILEHPNIVPLYDIQQDEKGEVYFTMRKIQGGTLRELLRKKVSGKSSYGEEHILSIFLKVCDAIAYAHSKGVIHRDLKPSNIMVGEFGEVYVMDWGIAKILNEAQEKELFKIDKSFVTMDGIGTFGYMAPEQKKNANKVSKRADIHALGKILRECYTRFSPLEELQHNVLKHEILYGKSHPKRFKNVEEFASNFPKDIEAIINKATQKESSARYGTVQELNKDLNLYLKNMRVSVRDYSPVEILKKWLQRNKQRIFLLTGVFFLLLLFVFWFYWEKKREQKEEFQKFYLQGKLELQKSKTINAEGKQNLGRKIQFLLNGLNKFKAALAINSTAENVQQEIVQLSQNLITLACVAHEFQIADYVAKEMASLALFSKENQQKLFEMILREQNKTLVFHQAQLKKWIRIFKEKKQKPGDRENVIFEIAKMQEEEIFQELLKILEAGTQYFLQNKTRSIKEEEFYEVFVLALGRLENPKAGSSLFHSLLLMQQKINTTPVASLGDIKFMSAIAQALGFSKAPNFSQALNKIRFQMGQHNAFWESTIQAFQQLAEVDHLEDKIPENANDFIIRGLAKSSQGNYQGAIQDFTSALAQNSKLIGAYNNRGIAKFYLKDFSGAIEDYSKALQIKPNNPLILTHRGNAKFQQGFLEEAIKPTFRSRI